MTNTKNQTNEVTNENKTKYKITERINKSKKNIFLNETEQQFIRVQEKIINNEGQLGCIII